MGDEYGFHSTCCYVAFGATPRHQELAVEDMRHELDDEGRREFFEEQGEDGDGGGGGRYGVFVCMHSLLLVTIFHRCVL